MERGANRFPYLFDKGTSYDHVRKKKNTIKMEHQASAVSAEERGRSQTTASRFPILSIWGSSLFQVDVPSVKIHGKLWFQPCKENTGLLAIHIHFNENMQTSVL